MLGENPFRSLRSGSQENAERIHHIRPELFLRVIRSMESPKWRLLFALLRFAGLRCPSELRPLEWSDVDWHPGRKSIRVRSPKTRKHSGHQHRLVPITKELQPFVVEAFEAAGKPSGPIFPNLESATRIRERLLKALNKLGIERWPRLMQNLRASCVIDWAQRWPLPEVTRWSGHSISVAMAHYLTTLDSNFREAVGASDWIRSSEPPSEPESGPNPSLTPDPRDQDEHSPPTPNPLSVPPDPGARRARPPRRTQGASRPIRGPASSGKNSPGYS
jgi:integrase